MKPRVGLFRLCSDCKEKEKTITSARTTIDDVCVCGGACVCIKGTNKLLGYNHCHLGSNTDYISISLSVVQIGQTTGERERQLATQHQF